MSNISRHANADTIRNIFSPIGELLHTEFYLSPERKDGTYEADLIFANLSEAKVAIELSRTELGDTLFTVESIMNRFRFSAAPGIVRAVLPREDSQDAVKTLLLRGLSADLSKAQLEVFLERFLGEKPLMVALYGKNIQRPDIDVGLDFVNTSMAAVEFSSRSAMLKGLLSLRAASADKFLDIINPDHVTSIQIDEAWKMVDPNIKRPEQLAIYQQRAQKTEVESHRRERSQERRRSRSRDRRHHRYSSRSRSRERYHHRDSRDARDSRDSRDGRSSRRYH